MFPGPGGRAGEEGRTMPDKKFAAVDLSIFKELKKISGERIRQARKALGFTQLEVATEMGGSLRWYRPWVTHLLSFVLAGRNGRLLGLVLLWCEV
ncbi:MAG: hypothetical protein B7Z20_06980, partial [Sphingobium sp. 32-64-5]